MTECFKGFFFFNICIAINVNSIASYRITELKNALPFSAKRKPMSLTTTSGEAQ